MGLFDFFKSSKDASPAQQQPTWDPNTLTMQQPPRPEAPSTERVVTEQPVRSHPRSHCDKTGVNIDFVYRKTKRR